MQSNFTDHNEFDKFVREQDEWIYDNGWNFEGEFFSAYMFERFDQVKSAKLAEHLVMLRDADTNKTIVLHGKDKEPHKFWSGVVSSQDDYQAMMDIVNKYIEEHKKNSGAT